jgi:hypothetical protein
MGICGEWKIRSEESEGGACNRGLRAGGKKPEDWAESVDAACLRGGAGISKKNRLSIMLKIINGVSHKKALKKQKNQGKCDASPLYD